MKKKVLIYLKKVFELKEKIAFYPAIFAVLGCLFAFIMLYLETLGVSAYISKNISQLQISDIDTARSILTTFIAGLISIKVFSFSMVMVLLNQASSNFSPRLLPGLISDRKHQIVLGVYIAVILYCIFILVFLKPERYGGVIPTFSILFAILLTIVSLVAFIYFIHSISEAIQIDNIMFKEYNKAKKRLEKQIGFEKKHSLQFSNTEYWMKFYCKTSGYVNDISIKTIKNIAINNGCKIYIEINVGTYSKKGQLLFKTDKELSETILQEIYDAILINISQNIKNNFLVAFKQLTEIAVKAMSPGINDPGTAINAIDYLSGLFDLRMHKHHADIIYNNKKAVLYINIIPFKIILYNTFSELRCYSSKDVAVVKKMIGVLNFLIENSEKNEQKKALGNELENVIADAKRKIKNKNDLTYLIG